RRGVDDPSVALLFHDPAGRPRAVDHAFDVDGEHAVDHVVGGLEHRDDRLRDPGVVRQDVELSVLADDPVDDRRRLGSVGHVQRARLAFAPVGTRTERVGHGPGIQHVRAHDEGALPAKSTCDSLPEPSRRPRHKSDAVVKSTHLPRPPPAMRGTGRMPARPHFAFLLRVGRLVGAELPNRVSPEPDLPDVALEDGWVGDEVVAVDGNDGRDPVRQGRRLKYPRDDLLRLEIATHRLEHVDALQPRGLEARRELLSGDERLDVSVAGAADDLDVDARLEALLGQGLDDPVRQGAVLRVDEVDAHYLVLSYTTSASIET